MKGRYTGFARLYYAMGYSWKGLKAAFKHEAAFRQELAGFVILFPLGLWLGKTGMEKAMLVSVLFIILIVELINSAIEAVVDRFGGEHHELSGRAKDIGSAAVTLALVLAGIVWTLVLWP